MKEKLSKIEKPLPFPVGAHSSEDLDLNIHSTYNAMSCGKLEIFSRTIRNPRSLKRQPKRAISSWAEHEWA